MAWPGSQRGTHEEQERVLAGRCEEERVGRCGLKQRESERRAESERRSEKWPSSISFEGSPLFRGLLNHDHDALSNNKILTSVPAKKGSKQHITS